MVFSRLICLSVCLSFALAPVTSGARPHAHRPIRHSRSAKRHTSPLLQAALFNPPVPVINPATFSWNVDKQGGFIMSICADLRGRLFVGGEDRGVWVYDAAQPAGKAWTQFTTRDGLGDDNAYALTCDRLGRIWMGSLNHGVSVFNGTSWKNYDILNGPLGSHVVALAVNPTNGDVWGATEAGLFRYREKQRDWQYITRADGLPSDQVSCLAFTKTGTIYAGTDCDGLAIADANLDHPKWRNVRGMDTLPLTASGNGLPTNLINCLLVTDDALYVGTTTGLACSRDGAKTFQFVRGKDYKDKIRGLYPPGKVPANAPDGALAEDYVTALVPASDGRLMVGCRSAAAALWPDTKHVDATHGLPDQPDNSDYTTVALRTGDRTWLLGHYGAGLHLVGTPPIQKSVRNDPGVVKAVPWPAEAGAVDLARLKALVPSVRGMSATGAFPTALYLADDWRTQGDWVGRLGRQYTSLCAVTTPLDHHLQLNPEYQCEGEIGPHHAAKDGLRGWIHWIKTDNPKTLYDTILGYRRQAEWDDHGEGYPMSYEGPDIVAKLHIPEGHLQRLTLYFMNKDGHDGMNRFRDYLIDVRRNGERLSVDAAEHPVRARVRGFWGGVYKSFLVSGPGDYTVSVHRNYSFNTLLSAVMVDKLMGDTNRHDRHPLDYMPGIHYDPPNPDTPEPIDPHALEKALAAYDTGKPLSITRPSLSRAEVRTKQTVQTARALWQDLDAKWDVPSAAPIQVTYRLFALRAIRALPGTDKLCANWRWKLRVWTDADRDEFKEVMKEAYEAVLKYYPQERGVVQ